MNGPTPTFSRSLKFKKKKKLTQIDWPLKIKESFPRLTRATAVAALTLHVPSVSRRLGSEPSTSPAAPLPPQPHRHLGVTCFRLPSPASGRRGAPALPSGRILRARPAQDRSSPQPGGFSVPVLFCGGLVAPRSIRGAPSGAGASRASPQPLEPFDGALAEWWGPRARLSVKPRRPLLKDSTAR